MRNSILLILALVIVSFFILSKNNNDKHSIVNLSDTIIIQPFNGTPDNYIDFVYSELIKIYSKVKISSPIPLPKSAYYAPRNRYRADSLISFLARETKVGYITLGITHKDISTTKNNVEDWGIMGLAFCPGSSCVISSYRLNKQNILIQLFKTAIHELGHTRGLEHCPVKNCFMRDAEGKNRADEETEFCTNCKKVLQDKGWKL